MSRYPPIGLNDKLRFGKYKGATVRQVIDHGDAGYITWCMTHINLSVTPEVELEIERCIQNEEDALRDYWDGPPYKY